MNTDQIAAEAAEQWFELYAIIGDKFKANSQLASIIKAAIEKATEQNNLAWGRRIGEKDNQIRALESRAAHASEPLCTCNKENRGAGQHSSHCLAAQSAIKGATSATNVQLAAHASEPVETVFTHGTDAEAKIPRLPAHASEQCPECGTTGGRHKGLCGGGKPATASERPIWSDICSKCGEPAGDHGDFGFRDHAFRDARGKAWDIDWSNEPRLKTPNQMNIDQIAASRAAHARDDLDVELDALEYHIKNKQTTFAITTIKSLRRLIESAIEKAIQECHKCDLPDSIKEALNSGDGTYRP